VTRELFVSVFAQVNPITVRTVPTGTDPCAPANANATSPVVGLANLFLKVLAIYYPNAIVAVIGSKS
jgi:hypothetical protein